MSKIKVLIELDDYVYKDVKESVYNVDSNYIEIGNAIGDGKVLPKTRKEVHKMLFGIDPPFLDSPFASCANSKQGCKSCKHKNDPNCDVNWWNEEMPILAADVADQAADIESEENPTELKLHATTISADNIDPEAFPPFRIKGEKK